MPPAGSTASFPDNGNGGFDYNVEISSGIVTADIDPVVESLTLLGGSLDTDGFDLTFNDASAWNGGTILDGGTVHFLGDLTLSGTTRSIRELAIVNNSGIANWTAGNFNSGSSAVFNNLASAAFATNFDGSFNDNLGGMAPTFNNDGTFVKNGGTGSTAMRVRFNNTNTGSINIDSGTVLLTGGGDHAGTISIADNARLEISGVTNFVPSADIAGLGEFAFANGTVNMNHGTFNVGGTVQVQSATVNLESDIDVDTLELLNGTRDGSATWTIHSDLMWNATTLTGNGTTRSNGMLDLTNNSTRTLRTDHVFENAGVAIWSSGRFNTGSNSTFNNLPNGTFETDFDGFFNYNLGGTTPTFNNAGLFSKVAGTGTTLVSARFDNATTGNLNVDSGTLRLSGGGSQQGSISIAESAALEVTNVTDFAPSCSLDCLGRFTCLGGTSDIRFGNSNIGGTFSIQAGTVHLNVDVTADRFVMDAGTRDGPGTLSANTDFVWNGGSLVGDGVSRSDNNLDLSNNAIRTLRSNHVFNNGGNALWSDGSFNSGSNAVFNNLEGASFETNFDGNFNYNLGGEAPTFNNAGTFSKNGGNGQTRIQTSFLNSGTVKADSGDLRLARGLTQNEGVTSLGGGTLTTTQTFEFTGGSIRGDGTLSAGDIIIANTNVTPGDGGTGQLTMDAPSVIVNNDSTLEIDIQSVNGTPGMDWDFITCPGTLSFDDGILPSDITVKLVSLDGNGMPGLLPGFDPAAQYTFAIAEANTIVGFDCSNVSIDLSDFQNALAASFRLEVDSSGPVDQLVVQYGGVLLGDINLDGSVNLLDVAPFVALISNGTFAPEADMNCDGQVNLLDVDPFIQALAN